MNIDKFGHHVHRRLRVDQILGLRDNISGALVKSSNGEYDLQSATLKGVKSPVAADEVVNKAYVDKLVQNFISKKELNFQLEIIKAELYKFTKINLENLYRHLKEESLAKNGQTANSK